MNAGIRLESFVRVHHSPQCNTVIGPKACEGRGEVQSSVWSLLQLFLQLLVENWIAALRSVSTDTASFVLSLNSPGIMYYHNEATMKFSVGKMWAVTVYRDYVITKRLSNPRWRTVGRCSLQGLCRNEATMKSKVGKL